MNDLILTEKLFGRLFNFILQSTIKILMVIDF